METNTISRMDVEKYLSKATFPCNKQVLISEAKNKSAPKEVIDALNGLPAREFNDIDDLYEEMDMGM